MPPGPPASARQLSWCGRVRLPDALAACIERCFCSLKDSRRIAIGYESGCWQTKLTTPTACANGSTKGRDKQSFHPQPHAGRPILWTAGPTNAEISSNEQAQELATHRNPI